LPINFDSNFKLELLKAGFIQISLISSRSSFNLVQKMCYIYKNEEKQDKQKYRNLRSRYLLITVDIQ